MRCYNYTTLYCTILLILYRDMRYCHILYHSLVYHALQYTTIVYSAILYCELLYCTAPQNTELFQTNNTF